jgi:hypothetical protein
MHIIVYISKYKGKENKIDEVLSSISAVAQDKNRALGITGVLFYLNGKFLQVIEGRQEALEELMIKVENDKRHTEIIRLIDEPIKERSYGDWNMDSFNLSKKSEKDLGDIKELSNSFKAYMELNSKLLVEFYKAMISE